MCVKPLPLSKQGCRRWADAEEFALLDISGSERAELLAILQLGFALKRSADLMHQNRRDAEKVTNMLLWWVRTKPALATKGRPSNKRRLQMPASA